MLKKQSKYTIFYLFLDKFRHSIDIIIIMFIFIFCVNIFYIYLTGYIDLMNPSNIMFVFNFNLCLVKSRKIKNFKFKRRQNLISKKEGMPPYNGLSLDFSVKKNVSHMQFCQLTLTSKQ